MNNYSVINFFVKDGRIFINLDKFHTLEDINFKLKPMEITTSLPLVPFQKQHEYKYPVFDEIKMVISDSIQFQAIYFEGTSVLEYTKERTYQLTSFTYELPTDPLLALHIITLFDSLLNCGFTETSVKDNIDEKGNFKTSLLKFFDELIYVTRWDEESGRNNLYINKSEFNNKHSFINAIITLSSIPEVYKPAFKKIKDFYDFCAFENLAFIDCLNNVRLNDLISNSKNPYFLLSNNINKSTESAIVDEIKKCLLQNDQSIQWNTIIKNIFGAKIYDLCEPCFGKLAYDGKAYSNSYTEVAFLKSMANNLTLKNDRICISNLNTNSAYLAYYAPGCRLHSVFKNELETIGKHIGLEFEECDFHKEIVLTKECSDSLIEKGFDCLIRINNLLDNFQKTSTHRNKYNLFSEPSSDTESNEDEFILKAPNQFCTLM